jgi:hypothetical protein
MDILNSIKEKILQKCTNLDECLLLPLNNNGKYTIRHENKKYPVNSILMKLHDPDYEYNAGNKFIKTCGNPNCCNVDHIKYEKIDYDRNKTIDQQTVNIVYAKIMDKCNLCITCLIYTGKRNNIRYYSKAYNIDTIVMKYNYPCYITDSKKVNNKVNVCCTLAM